MDTAEAAVLGQEFEHRGRPGRGSAIEMNH
jgi:hypothetical protein